MKNEAKPNNINNSVLKIGLFYVHPMAQENKLTLDGLWGSLKSGENR